MWRLILRSCALALSLIAIVSDTGRADTYPSKPVQMIIFFNPGAVVDILGRTMAEEMGQLLNQQFVVVNREGAGGMVGVNVAAQAKPDGYTLLFGPPGPITIQPHIRKDLAYSLDSFTPICQVFENQFVVVVGHNSPLKSLDEVIKGARANPGKMSWGVFGIGGVPHLQFYSLLLDAKADMLAVPYKSIATMMADATSGQIDIGVTAFGSFGIGTVRVLASLAGQRNELYPDVPAAPELGYRVSDSAYGGFLATKGTPPEALRALEGACAKAHQSARYKEVLKRTGSPGPYLGAEGYAKRLKEDSRVKGELVRLLDIKAE
jgi:tripartite-type tricarboxylate transporter receptor subunit TctC